MAFLEDPPFPDVIAAWAEGGGGFKTTAVETYGGFEYRNQAWRETRGEFSIAEALRSGKVDSAFALKILRNLQRQSRGMFGGFRFRNYAEQDFEDEGQGVFQLISGSDWQMYKAYPTTPPGADTYQKKIQKPRSGTVVVTPGGFTVDYTTGIATGAGTPLSWTGQFDVPARLNMDLPRFGLTPEGAFFNWADVRIIEIRLPEAS